MFSRLSILLIILFAFNYSKAQLTISLDIYENGFSSPIGIYNAGDARLFIVERSGFIRIIDENGDRLLTPFLNIDNLVIATGGSSEQGLLGLAFHPDYTNNGFFYVHYINNSGDSQISRFSVSAGNPNVADPGSEKQIMTVDQPFGNHNGGDLAFGPDGYLYIGFGDGGSGGDPGNRAQNPETLLGKMLRIDINTSDNVQYFIPPDNPFVNNPTTLDEIWAIGIRNPWRFSFDRLTGDLWIADVGQNQWEEINMQLASSPGGENYGWRCYEGDAAFNLNSCPNANTLKMPIFDYNHQNFTHCSITGGYLYRGCQYPDLTGRYFYADYCSGRFSMLTPNTANGYDNSHLTTFSGFAITAFGEDVDGELYVSNMNNGTIYKMSSNSSLTIGEPFVNENTLTAQQGFDSYQWYLNGNAIEGAIENIYEALESGSYTVEGFNDNGCSVISNAVDLIIVSTFKADHLRTLNINPNPFNSRIAVIAAFKDSDNYTFTIHDLTGKKIIEKQILGSQQVQVVKFDLADLQGGVYLLKISGKDGDVSKKLVKY